MFNRSMLPLLQFLIITVFDGCIKIIIQNNISIDTKFYELKIHFLERIPK
jgi:hypothetical protein